MFAVRDVTVHGGTPALAHRWSAAMRAAVGEPQPACTSTPGRSSARSRDAIRPPRGRRPGLPNTLAVSVAMEHPKLAAQVGNHYTLVAADGRVLGAERRTAPVGLPVVSLPPGTTLGVADDCRRCQPADRASR